MNRGIGMASRELKKASTSQSRCARCGGLMVSEWCIDLLDDTGGIDFAARRCVQCGELVDPVIFHNRQIGPAGFPRRRRLSPAGVS
jgi:ribosomal protein S27AE